MKSTDKILPGVSRILALFLELSFPCVYLEYVYVDTDFFSSFLSVEEAGGDRRCISFPIWGQGTQTHNLKEKRYNLLHSFEDSDMVRWLQGRNTWKGVMEEKCPSHSNKEAERKSARETGLSHASVTYPDTLGSMLY